MTPLANQLYAQSVPPLTREEEQRLARKALAGDRSAEAKLVQANVRWVIGQAIGYAKHYGGEIDDYIQEGLIGLVKGIRKFEPDRGLKLVSYAQNWIKAYIHNFIIRSFSVVKIGTTQVQRRLFFQLRTVTNELSRGGVEPSSADLAEVLGCRVDEVESMQVRMGGDFALDAPTNPGGVGVHDAGNSFLDFVVAPEASPEDLALSADQRRHRERLVRDVLRAHENDRNRVLLQQRMMSDTPVSLAHIGVQFGVSRERVRQLEIVLKEKLRSDFSRAVAQRKLDPIPEIKTGKRGRGRPRKVRRTA